MHPTSAPAGQHGSAYFSWVQDIEHRVGGSSGDKQDAIDDHREAAERPMALAAIRPETLDPHFDGEYNRDEGEQSDPYNKPPHSKTICCHQVEQVHRH